MDLKRLQALAESIRAQTVWEASPGIVVKLMDCSDGITALLEANERLETQWTEVGAAANKALALAEHWKANHDHQVSRARFLIERGDIPVERIRAYEEMGTLRAVLQDIVTRKYIQIEYPQLMARAKAALGGGA